MNKKISGRKIKGKVFCLFSKWVGMQLCTSKSTKMFWGA